MAAKPARLLISVCNTSGNSTILAGGCLDSIFCFFSITLRRLPASPRIDFFVGVLIFFLLTHSKKMRFKKKTFYNPRPPKKKMTSQPRTTETETKQQILASISDVLHKIQQENNQVAFSKEALDTLYAAAEQFLHSHSTAPPSRAST